MIRKDVVIKNGELISGVIDKSSIGAEEPESVLHRIAKDYGNAYSKELLEFNSYCCEDLYYALWISYGYSDLWLKN